MIKALPDTDTPLINYLAAARAAQEQGNSKQRDRYLRQAQKSMPDAKIAVELTQAQLQIANQQFEQALATLKHLHDLAPKHPYVLKLLVRLYKEIQDWQSVIDLLPTLKKNSILTKKEINELELNTYIGLLHYKSKLLTHDELTQYYQHLPKHIAQNPKLLCVYAKYLLNQQKYAACELLIKSGLKKHWDEQLVELYGLCINDVKKQLTYAESLIKNHPGCAKLYLSLGRLSISNQLWGKARTYLEKSIELAPSAEAYSELGKLLDSLHEGEQAKEYFKKGLMHSLKQSQCQSLVKI